MFDARRLVGAALAGLLMLGCSGSEEQPPEPPLNFARITKEVITAGACGGQLCHSTIAGGLVLAPPDELYASLIGVKAGGPECGMSGMDRVVPADSANSLLYLKLSHTQPCGDPMPLIALPPSKVELVRRWIDAGAPKD